MTDKPQDDQGAAKEKPKIIVDDDWKAQAQAEKAKLAQEVEEGAQAEAPSAAPGGAAAPGQHELPPADFASLVSSVATQALLALGGMEDRRTKKRVVDLDLAKHHVDTLAMLEVKTRGNLTDDEKKMLDQALYETRMQYVQFAQQFGGL